MKYRWQIRGKQEQNRPTTNLAVSSNIDTPETRDSKNAYSKKQTRFVFGPVRLWRNSWTQGVRAGNGSRRRANAAEINTRSTGDAVSASFSAGAVLKLPMTGTDRL